MKILNLTNLEKSDIKYQISQFPDGQQNILFQGIQVGLIKGYCNPQFIVPIQIQSRFNSFRDLELIICTIKALRRLGVREIHLYIPYLLGARSDRQFQEGGNSYLVDVIAPIINAQNFESVTVLDVHSDVAAACIKNLKVDSNKRLVNFAINEIAIDKSISCQDCIKQFILISPDAGAQKKIYKIAESIGYTGEVITCSKSRDTEGKLTNTIVPIKLSAGSTDYIIIDDICDGGRTFINIAAKIKEQQLVSAFKSKIHLIVTHGIFSAGYTELFKYFDTIYTTNSIKDIGGLNGNSNKRINVKQLNVI